MVHDTEIENKADSIGKAIDNLRGVVNTPLSRIKVGLEKSYLDFYRKAIGIFDHSYRRQYMKGK